MQWFSSLSFSDYYFGFAFLYPLFMAWLWIAGGIWFFLKREYKQNKIPQPSEHACSILIPCFNEQDQVRETIKYAMQTQYPDFEVIAINDGSKDKTAEILDELQKQNFKIQVGPGVYDIHSPRIPSVEEITETIRAILAKVPKEKVWINPDCGLKTRGERETKASLENMTQAVKTIRKEL